MLVASIPDYEFRAKVLIQDGAIILWGSIMA